jgi:hypothetical protein
MGCTGSLCGPLRRGKVYVQALPDPPAAPASKVMSMLVNNCGGKRHPGFGVWLGGAARRQSSVARVPHAVIEDPTHGGGSVMSWGA